MKNEEIKMTNEERNRQIEEDLYMEIRRQKWLEADNYGDRTKPRYGAGG